MLLLWILFLVYVPQDPPTLTTNFPHLGEVMPWNEPAINQSRWAFQPPKTNKRVWWYGWSVLVAAMKTAVMDRKNQPWWWWWRWRGHGDTGRCYWGRWSRGTPLSGASGRARRSFWFRLVLRKANGCWQVTNSGRQSSELCTIYWLNLNCRVKYRPSQTIFIFCSCILIFMPPGHGCF